MSIKLIKSYLIVAQEKQDNEKIVEAMACYNSALSYLQEFCRSNNLNLNQLGILTFPANAQESKNAFNQPVVDTREIFQLSLTRAIGMAECQLATQSPENLTLAKDLFIYLLNQFPESNNNQLTWAENLTKALCGLQLYNDALNTLTTYSLSTSHYTNMILQADILSKLDNHDEALQIYVNALNEIEHHNKDEENEPIDTDGVMDKIKKTKSAIRMQQSTVNMCLPVDKIDKPCTHNDMRCDFASTDEALKEVKALLTKNPNLKHLNLEHPYFVYEHRRIHNRSRNITNKQVEKRGQLIRSGTSKVLKMLKFNKTLHTLTIHSDQYCYNEIKSAAASSTLRIALMGNDKNRTFNKSLFAINIGLSHSGNKKHHAKTFADNRTAITTALTNNFGRHLQKKRIFQAFVILTFAMRVNKDQNWDRLIGNVLSFLEDPADKMAKKYIQEPQPQQARSRRRQQQGKFTFGPIKSSIAKQEKVSQEESKEAMMVDNSDLPVAKAQEVSPNKRADKCTLFSSANWISQYYNGNLPGTWKLNMAVKTPKIQGVTVPIEKKSDQFSHSNSNSGGKYRPDFSSSHSSQSNSSSNSNSGHPAQAQPMRQENGEPLAKKVKYNEFQDHEGNESNDFFADLSLNSMMQTDSFSTNNLFEENEKLDFAQFEPTCFW